MKNKLIGIAVSVLMSSPVFATNDINTEMNKAEALKKLDSITQFYMEELAKTEHESKKIDSIIAQLEIEIKNLNVSKEEIEVRKDLIKELYIDLEDTKNLYVLEFDKNGNIKNEIKEAALAIKMSLNDESKLVKVKLPNGKHLPLIKYVVKRDDTLKKILLHTYPQGYTPTWKEVSKRINTLVKINKNVIKMNYIYPGQVIYIPLFKDNPTQKDVKANLINQKIKKIKQ